MTTGKLESGKMKSPLKIYKCDAQGDTVYIRAKSEEQAREILFGSMGEIPDSLLTWSTVEKLPEGEEFLYGSVKP